MVYWCTISDERSHTDSWNLRFAQSSASHLYMFSNRTIEALTTAVRHCLLLVPGVNTYPPMCTKLSSVLLRRTKSTKPSDPSFRYLLPTIILSFSLRSSSITHIISLQNLMPLSADSNKASPFASIFPRVLSVFALPPMPTPRRTISRVTGIQKKSLDSSSLSPATLAFLRSGRGARNHRLRIGLMFADDSLGY